MPVKREIWDRYLDGEIDRAATHDRVHQRAFAAASATPVYAMAAPNVMDREPLKDVFLGRYMVMGMQSRYGSKYVWLPQYQERGTCVGQSHAALGTCVTGVNALLAGLKFPGRTAVAPVYAGSRVEVGKNAGNWDGSTGSWAAEWMSERGGLVTFEELGLNDNPASEKEWLATMRKDETMAVQWAASRSGVPENFEGLARVRPIKAAPAVTTVEEVRAALSNLTPVNICGSVHPSRDLDSRGVSKSLSRGGGHSTGIIGQYFDGSNWWYDHLQSWWWYYQGGFCRSSNRIDKMFARAVTRIPESWLSHWLSERDCYALVGVQGLEPIDKSLSKVMED